MLVTPAPQTSIPSQPDYRGWRATVDKFQVCSQAFGQAHDTFYSAHAYLDLPTCESFDAFLDDLRLTPMDWLTTADGGLLVDKVYKTEKMIDACRDFGVLSRIMLFDGLADRAIDGGDA